MAKAKGGVGKQFEKLVYTELQKLQMECGLFVHRFVDSHDAGRFVSPQPSDFLLATKRFGTVYLEVKSSTVHLTLSDAKDLFRPQQIGKLSLLDRAGQPVYALFFSEPMGTVELWCLNGELDLLAVSGVVSAKCFVDVYAVGNMAALIKKSFV